MKKNKWIVNGIAVFALLLVFLPDLTGFSLHEWIGLAIAGVLLVHFFQHLDWVVKTTQRLTSLKWKVFSRYLVDGVLALGFAAITLTGLVISSLLMLPLVNYETWRLVHVIASYATAILLVVKLAMHWEMIAKQIKDLVAIDTATMTPAQQDRRKFLRGFGVTAIASLIAIGEIKEWIGKTAVFEVIDESGIDESVESMVIIPTMEPTDDSEVLQDSGSLAEVVDEEIVENAEVETEQTEDATIPTEVPTVEPTTEPTVEPTEVLVSGVVKCRKGCSYPGRCGRYFDDNQNGKCDLGEPIW